MVIEHDNQKFKRLTPNNGELVHAMALSLELGSQATTHLAIDAEQAQQLARALRVMAENADTSVIAYNHMIDVVESYDRLDAARARLRRSLLRLAFALGIVVCAGLVLWLI